MDPSYKPRLPKRPSPRFNINNNITTSPGGYPQGFQCDRFVSFVLLEKGRSIF